MTIIGRLIRDILLHPRLTIMRERFIIKVSTRSPLSREIADINGIPLVRADI